MGLVDTILSDSSFVGRRDAGLIFDTEGVTLICRCSDQVSSYRSRRAWVEILNSYFLLENERDYQMSILSCPEQNIYVLNCYFTSACGRYAFWRLINDQAPEAETKLLAVSSVKRKPTRKFFPSLWHPGPVGNAPNPWVLTADDALENSSSSGFLDRLIAPFKRLF